MEQGFIDILKTMVKEQGKESLTNVRKCKALLADYTKNEYKKESRLLLQAVEGGAAAAIDGADDLAACKKAKIREAEEEQALNLAAATDIVNTLALVLRGDTNMIEASPSASVNTNANVGVNTSVTASKSATGIEMILIPAGGFQMGCPASEPGRLDAEKQHPVTLTHGFSMGKYQVTQGQYMAVMGTNPSDFTGDTNCPVESVSWYDAIVFCNKLSLAEGLSPAYKVTGVSNWNTVTAPTSTNTTWNAATIDPNSNGYRLPTEAQWEYAARGDYPNKATETNTKPFGIGDGTKITSNMANFDGNRPYDVSQGGQYDDPTGTSLKRTTAVGSYAPNNYGLYNMHGNVWEWCWDWYGASYYTDPAAGVDPAGPASGSGRVVRGGSWRSGGRHLRPAFRSHGNPSEGNSSIGFRLVRP